MGERRRLTRSLTDRVLGGVCGGMSAYTGLNALWIRLLFLLMAPSTSGFGVLLYIVLWLVLPIEAMDDLPALAPVRADNAPESVPRGSGVGQLALGIAAMLMGAGLLLLNSGVLPFGSGDLFWPVAALSIGLALLWRQLRGV
jgi:phage shock protein PspC (stress-responsive transcriptional regulator)